MRARGRTALAALAGGLALLGCDGSGGQAAAPRAAESSDPTAGRTDPLPSATPSRSPSGSGAPSTGSTDGNGTLLDVSGRTLDGGELDLATLHGDQLVLWMWAPW